jgi:hypothetical protein
VNNYVAQQGISRSKVKEKKEENAEEKLCSQITFNKYDYNNLLEEEKMRGSCGMYGREKGGIRNTSRKT